MKGRNHWSTQEDEHFRMMWERGDTLARIATCLGRTNASVRQRRAILGLPTRIGFDSPNRAGNPNGRPRKAKRVTMRDMLNPRNGNFDSSRVLWLITERCAA